LGIFRAWQFLTEKDSDTRKPKPFVQKWKGKIINLFPCLKTDSSTPINTYYLMSTFLIGLFTTGLHPKTSIVAIAVGHQIIRADGEFAKISGATLFTILALLPSIFPLVLSIYRPEAGPALKDKCTALLEKHGRWIAALLCFAFAFVLWRDALAALPR
jgi:threonine/homoserine/homoserine lactone efflux protein